MEDKKAMLLQLDHDASDDVTAIICSGLKVFLYIFETEAFYYQYLLYKNLNIYFTVYCIFLDGLCIFLLYIQSLCIFAYLKKIIYNFSYY